MRKEMDPKIQAAATSYAEQFSGGTTLAHFVAKTAAFDASAFANSAMRAKGPAVWAPLGGLRGICAPYTRGASLCQSGNKRSPREKRMAFARLKKSP